MNKPGTIDCDAIKIAYRQSKDGFVVSFAIHPQDMPADLANADIGSQWRLTLVGLDDDGNARLTDGAGASAPRAAESDPCDSDAPPPARRAFSSLPLPKQAGMLCRDAMFRMFLKEEYAYSVEADTAEFLRNFCNVKSRADLTPVTVPGQSFISLRDQFDAWKLVAT